MTRAISISAILVVMLQTSAACPPLLLPPAPVTEKLTIAGKEFELEIAADEKSREKGLMDREEIKDRGGMLFVYPSPRLLSYWMKNCLVDMDILFLDRRGRIVSAHEMKVEPPRKDSEFEYDYEARLKRYSCRRPAQFVIELKAGTIERLELEPGQHIELDTARLKSLAN